MDGLATTGNDCIAFRFEGALSSRQISKSVGQGGFNLKPDVLKIQKLLNLISPKDGGPLIPLKEDGFIGPKTLGAIRSFQAFHSLGSDGRVDPNGLMLKKMNEVPKEGLALRNSRILLKVVQSMPDLVAMAGKAVRKIEEAMDFVRLGAGGLFTKKKSFDLAELHFAFGNQSDSVTLSELAFIRTTYDRVSTVLRRHFSPITGGNPFGVNIFTIDPLGLPHFAYSPTQAGDAKRPIPEVHSGLVFLGEKSDTAVPDLFTHILFHELIHFVDDESGGRNIGDAGKYREKAMRAAHAVRMRNSDNYALFATHNHMGRSRLLASQPTLNSLIPADL